MPVQFTQGVSVIALHSQTGWLLVKVSVEQSFSLYNDKFHLDLFFFCVSCPPPSIFVSPFFVFLLLEKFLLKSDRPFHLTLPTGFSSFFRLRTADRLSSLNVTSYSLRNFCFFVLSFVSFRMCVRNLFVHFVKIVGLTKQLETSARCKFLFLPS